MGLGTMTVLHDANVAGSDPILNGVYAGGFESLVEATRQVMFRDVLSCYLPTPMAHISMVLLSMAMAR